MVGSKKTRGKTAAMAKSAMAQSHSTHDSAIDMVAPPPLTIVPPTRLTVETIAPVSLAQNLVLGQPGEERRMD
ncbi:unnamed protein product [Prunus armeniaca]